MAVLALGLLAPLTAAAQSASGKATDGPAAAPLLMEEAPFVLVDGLIDLTPTPEELAAQGLSAAPAAPAASATTEAAFTAYPNPAAERATVRFTLEAPAAVRLTVYDLLGREVAVLVDGAVEAGTHEAAFDGSRLPSGVYLVRLDAGGTVQTQRLTLLR
ncbi:MAG TPA: T9SS type A sorting domain-containing protein [Rubricoccaceae bacterium]|nr:T9SS type A sorting domain-containing protein [Rubricoccaceae bacterium]